MKQEVSAFNRGFEELINNKKLNRYYHKPPNGLIVFNHLQEVLTNYLVWGNRLQGVIPNEFV
jgi:hypothetical protein